MRCAISTTLLCAIVWAGTGLVDCAQAREPASAAAELEVLNENFRSLYRQRTQQVLEALPLVLVVQNHTITAVRGNQRKLYPVPLQRYNEARAVVHAALGFNGLMEMAARQQPQQQQQPQQPQQQLQEQLQQQRLQQQQPQPHQQPPNAVTKAGLPPESQARLAAYLQNLDRTHRALTRSSLTRDEKAHARRALDILRAAAHRALLAQNVTHADIVQALSAAEPSLSALSASIGHAHAQALQSALRSIQAEAKEEEWKDVLVVVTGPMTPRRNNLETAAVASVLGAEHLGTRIFYAENIFSVDGALSYLQTLVGDRELSVNVFGQPQRMWEDLFAPVSRTLVDKPFYTELSQ